MRFAYAHPNPSLRSYAPRQATFLVKEKIVMIKHAVFKIFPILVCRREQIKEANFPKRVEELKENILPEAQVLEEAIISDEKELIHLERYIDETDVVLLYKPKLGSVSRVKRIIEFNRPGKNSLVEDVLLKSLCRIEL